MNKENIAVTYVPVSLISPNEYNPRTHSSVQKDALTESIKRFGFVDPLICNNAQGREHILIGGHFRLEIAKELGYAEVPVVYVNIPDLKKEKELNLRLHKNQGEFDLELLAEFDESLLSSIGFSSEELDAVFDEELIPEEFNLKEELAKLNITEIKVQKGDIYEIDGSRLMCGDSTVEADMLKLCGDEKIDMVMTDPPYRLDYLNGKTRHGKPTEGFGAKKNRKYLETDILPHDFTELWMANVDKVARKEGFSIICYENWKNIREIWNVMEKYWKVRNMIVWHLPNRNQGYAGAHKFFSKHDIAMVGTSEADRSLAAQDEGELLENLYETALFAISGKPHWEPYEKGKKYCPTDFIEYVAADEKSSGQGIIFGTKPIEILIPYIKVLTKRDDLVLEPFGGSGSTLIASIKMKRRCCIMEKSPVYAEVIKRRWEQVTGKKAIKVN